MMRDSFFRTHPVAGANVEELVRRWKADVEADGAIVVEEPVVIPPQAASLELTITGQVEYPDAAQLQEEA